MPYAYFPVIKDSTTLKRTSLYSIRKEDFMDIIYILIPLSIVLIGIAITVLFWAIKSGQFDDMDSPAHRILFDDDDQLPK